MPYLLEEAAVLDGLIAAYFTSPSLSDTIRQSYLTVHRHMQSGQLTNTDYQRIRSAVYFLLPMLQSQPTDYKLMVSVLAKTNALLGAQTM